MKRLDLFAIISLGLFTISCGGGDDDSTGGGSTSTEYSVTFTPTSISATAEGSTTDVLVTSDYKDWQIFAKDNDGSSDFITATRTSQTTATITVAENTTYDSRTGVVVVKAGTTRKELTVSQDGKVEDTSIDAPDGYTLVWNDEFTSSSLSGDWSFEVQKPGWVNNELQEYINSSSVAYISDGTLKIKCYKDGSNIYSGRIYAKKSSGWKYGYIEASIKLPTGKGTWPAFWMMPVNYTAWPDDGEIDIMEEVGYNPNVVVSTIHCNKYNNSGTSIESASKTVSTAQSEFHKYALEWTATYMTFYVDGVKLLTYNNDGTGTDAWPFNAAFYPILNLAWGGSWGGAQGVDESALPATMEVDYVRVFQK